MPSAFDGCLPDRLEHLRTELVETLRKETCLPRQAVVEAVEMLPDIAPMQVAVQNSITANILSDGDLIRLLENLVSNAEECHLDAYPKNLLTIAAIRLRKLSNEVNP